MREEAAPGDAGRARVGSGTPLGWRRRRTACLREEPQLFPKSVVLTSTESSAHHLASLELSPVIKTLTKPFPLSALLDWPGLVASDESTPPQAATNVVDSRCR